MKRKKAVILLGAGFSIPFGGPSSKELLESIENDPFTNYDEEFQSQLIPQLLKTLRSYYGNEQVNFETLIATIESLCQFTMSSIQKQKSVDYSSILPAIYQQINAKLIEKEASSIDKTVPEYLIAVYKHCIDVILRRICRYDNMNIEKNVKSDGLRRFAQSLLDRDYHIKFYTTNYDRIVPRLINSIRFEEGLQGNMSENTQSNIDFDISQNSIEWLKGRLDSVEWCDAIVTQIGENILYFHNDIIRFHKAPFTYFNLHGSRYLSQHSSRDICYMEGGTDYISSSLRLNQGGNPNEHLLFSPIIVGYTKSQRALSNPFHFGITSFTMDCNTCDKFFSFGFSYKDPHINSIIDTYLKKNVMIECVVQGKLDISINSPHHFWCQKDYQVDGYNKCNAARVFVKGIENYLEKDLYEKYIDDLYSE